MGRFGETDRRCVVYVRLCQEMKIWGKKASWFLDLYCPNNFWFFLKLFVLCFFSSSTLYKTPIKSETTQLNHWNVLFSATLKRFDKLITMQEPQTLSWCIFLYGLRKHTGWLAITFPDPFSLSNPPTTNIFLLQNMSFTKTFKFTSFLTQVVIS